MEYENQEEEQGPPPPQQQQITPEEYLAERKSTIRNRSWWAIGIGIAIVVFHLLLFSFAILFKDQIQQQYPDDFDAEFSWKLLFRSLFFILGLFAIVGGIWGLREARRLKLDDLIPSPEAIAFAQQAQNTTPYYSYIIVICLIAVFLFESAAGVNENGGYKALTIAGLLKPDVWSKGEYWRILTSAALHGGLLHIYFNSQALYGFGSLIEYLSNRAHLAIVFLLSIIGGGILSIIFMPEGNSVGASGGIIGLLGYMAIYGFRRKQQLPPDFLKSLLINIGFIAAFGLVAYQIIDNFGHIGGFITGAIYGFLQIPKDLDKNPRNVRALTEALGIISVGAFVFTSVLTILLILEIIKF